MGAFSIILQLTPQPGDPVVTVNPSSSAGSVANHTFTGNPIAQNNGEGAVIPASSGQNTINRIVLISTQKLDFFLGFYSTPAGAAAGVANNAYCGGAILPASSAIQVADVPAAENQYVYDVEVSIPTFDAAGGTSIYAYLSPRSGVKTTSVQARLFYSPST